MSFGSTEAAISGFEKRLTKFGEGCQVAAATGTNEAALLVTNHIAGFLGGRSIRLRGVGRSGANVSVRYEASTGTTNPKALVHMKGPAKLVEDDIAPHELGSRKADNGEQPRMTFPSGEWATGPFMGGGSTGRHPFARGVESARPLIPEAYHRGVVAAGRKAFGFGG